MAKQDEVPKAKDETKPAGDKGPTSIPAGTGAEKPKRTRGPRKASTAGLTQDDLRSFETYLTGQIQAGRKDDNVSDDQLEAWGDTRKRVRGLLAPATSNEGGAK